MDTDEIVYGGAECADFSSSNIDSFRYEHDKEELWVTFLNGAVYAYFHVPPDIVAGWVTASSKGKYHWAHIRNDYEYLMLQGRTS